MKSQKTYRGSDGK